MKNMLWLLIVLSLLGKLMKKFLPRGEKSALYPALRFLLSLCMVAAVFSPWFFLLKNQPSFSDTLDVLFLQDQATDTDRLILEKIGSTMKKSVDTAFPNQEYSLEIYTGEENVPVLVKVRCNPAEAGFPIAEFIQKNYGLEAVVEQGEE